MKNKTIFTLFLALLLSQICFSQYQPDQMAVQSDPTVILNNLALESFDNDFKFLPDHIRVSYFTDHEKELRYKNILEKVFGTNKLPVLVLFKYPYPFAALGNQSLITVSDTTFDFFNEEELAFIFYHEISHLIYTKEYEKAYFSNDFTTLRSIEMKCDSMSVVVGLKVNLKPTTYISTLKRLNKYENKIGQDNSRLSMYPKLSERLENIKKTAKLLDSFNK